MPRTARTASTISTLSAIVTALALLTACSTSSSTSASGRAQILATPLAQLHRPYPVGITTRTYVDASRPTQANGTAPARPDRTLFTTVVYPATATSTPTTLAGGRISAITDAPADRAGGPFPLVVFAHGFGGDEQLLLPMAAKWAEAGYVVALPRFPLTTLTSPGGINGADIANQPADVGFVIDSITQESASSASSPIHGAVDAGSIALAGHSNGAITTLGTIANSCCRDARIDAAIVFAGVTSPFGGGTYDLTDIPPVLFVHATGDAQIDYDQAARNAAEASAPRGMLRIEGGSHISILVPTSPEFATVAAATIDFLDATLRGDDAARRALPTDQKPGVATMFWADDDAAAASAPVPTTPRSTLTRTATISAQDQLRAGQRVTVTWKGFTPGKTVNIVQCTGDGKGGSETCEIVPGRVLIPDPTGEGSLDVAITVGKVGNGVCDADHPCTMLVNDAGLQDRDAFVYFPLTFAR